MKILASYNGLWCTKCETLCRLYEQGLCCACDQPWETERLDEAQYPAKWIKVVVEVQQYE